MSGDVRRLVLGALVLVSFTGCTKWTPRYDAVLPVVERERPHLVRVTHQDGRQTVLLRPVVRDSTLIGRTKQRNCFVNSAGTRLCQQRPLEAVIPASDVTYFDTGDVDRAGRGALVGGSAMVAFVSTMMVGGGYPCFDYASECARLLFVSGLGGAIWGAIIGGLGSD